MNNLVICPAIIRGRRHPPAADMRGPYCVHTESRPQFQTALCAPSDAR